MTSRLRSGHAWLPAAAYTTLVTAIGAFLLLASRDLTFHNQGDWARSALLFLGEPVGGLPEWNDLPFGVNWSFKDSPGPDLLTDNSSSQLFRLHVAVQSLYSETFSLLNLALTAKIFLLVIIERLAQRMARSNGFGPVGRLALFSALALTVFASHNIAVLSTFYREFALFLFLPVTLLALMSLESPAWRVVLVFAALMCGSAKLQFFYVPLLLIVLLFYLRIAYRHRFDAGLVAALVAVQVVCAVPLFRYDYLTAINRYHATFLGSYLVMTDAELDAIGLATEARACIGVDAWGHRLNDLRATATTAGHRTCYTNDALPLARVITPYAGNPMLLIRVLSAVSPSHFSSAYFHTSEKFRYLRSLRADGRFGLGELLIRLSSIRDVCLMHGGFLVTVVLGLLLPLLGRDRVPMGIAASSLLLVAFLLSQIVVCVLGEGVRDLGRHLSAAQYAMDILVVLCAVQLVRIVRPGVANRKESMA